MSSIVTVAFTRDCNNNDKNYVAYNDKNIKNFGQPRMAQNRQIVELSQTDSSTVLCDSLIREIHVNLIKQRLSLLFKRATVHSNTLFLDYLQVLELIKFRFVGEKYKYICARLEDPCPICYDNTDSEKVLTRCEHVICMECYSKISVCPVCREECKL